MVLSVGAAAAAWRAALAAAGCPDVLDVERVPVPDAAGRVAAGPVRALASVPAVPCAAAAPCRFLRGAARRADS